MQRQQAIDAIDQYIDIMMDSFRNQRSMFEGFSMRDLHILAFVDREHENHVVTISELAYHLKVTPAAASQIVTSYENKGWLIRTRSASDRRTVYISLAQDLRNIFLERRKNLHSYC